MAAGEEPVIEGNRFWLVDPLDGTKEFLNRNGEFTVNIALIEDGQPAAGVVHAPALAMTWAGVCGDDSDGNKRSEEHTSELQSPMRTSYAVFCLQNKKNTLR